MLTTAVLAFSLSSLGVTAGEFQGAQWSIDQHRTMIWNGRPYLPLGWRLPGSPDAIRAAKQTGVEDVLLELPSTVDWSTSVAAAEDSQLNYLITLSDDAPKAPAYVIRPEMYRIDGVSARGTYTVPLRGVSSAYYVLITSRGFHVDARGWVKIEGDTGTIEINQRVVSDSYTLLIYPRVESSELNDYWENFDKRRDDLLKRLQATRFGTGLRGIVAPLGRVEKYTAYEGGIVPDTELFRLEFQAFLESKYGRDIDALIRSWRLRSPDIDDFAQAARMIPLFSKTRGADQLWDPKNDSIVSVDIFATTYWTDLQTVIDNAAARRLARLGESIRRVADVPVVYEWSGWSSVYDTRRPAGNGIGIRAHGSGLTAIEEYASRPVSSAVAWQNPGWLIATELSGGPGDQPFEDQRSLSAVISNLANLGVKGWFVKWVGGPESAWIAGIAAAVRADTSIATSSVRAVFYPENARFPANTMRLPGGVWWLPTPAAGNRLELGPGYEAYRHDAPYGTFTAIWRTDEPKRTKLLLANTQDIVITSADGRPIDTRTHRDGIELTLDTTPILIYGTEDVPVPQDTVDAIQAEYKALTAGPNGRVMGTGDYRFLFEDAVKRLRQNPGAAYLAMLDSLRKLHRTIGTFEWIEGEAVEETTFGHVYPSPACSGERALGIDTPFHPLDDAFFAQYRVRLDEGEREFWIAARIPGEVLPFVEVEIGGSIRQLEGGTGGYGPGFAWYSLGRVNPQPGSYTIIVRLKKGAPQYRMSIDAILLTKRPFRPSGPRMPTVF